MVKVTITVDDKDAQKKLSDIIKQLEQPKKLFGVLGEQLKKDHRQRFKEQRTPDGKAWKPLAPWYAANKRKGKGQILVARGQLRNTLAYNYNSTELEFGSPLIYARIHQFGGTVKPKRASMLALDGGRLGFAKQVDIPARPWLGLSQQNKNVLLLKAREHLEKTLK